MLRRGRGKPEVLESSTLLGPSLERATEYAVIEHAVTDWVRPAQRTRMSRIEQAGALRAFGALPRAVSLADCARREWWWAALDLNQ